MRQSWTGNVAIMPPVYRNGLSRLTHHEHETLAAFQSGRHDKARPTVLHRPTPSNNHFEARWDAFCNVHGAAMVPKVMIP
eukprot:885676-Rhodomonas_salina.3